MAAEHFYISKRQSVSEITDTETVLDGIMEHTREITNGDRGWTAIGECNSSENEQKTFLSDELIKLTQNGKLKWMVVPEKESPYIVFCLSGKWTFAVIQNPGRNSRYFGGATYEYILYVTHDRKKYLRLENSYDSGIYNTSSKFLPIMDLYDVVMSGRPRKRPKVHTCGIRGSGLVHGLDRSCSACKEQSAT